MKSTAYTDEWQLGEWRVQPRTGLIVQGDTERRLEPKVMGLLLLLASRAGEPISRDEILAELWTDTIVGEDALPRCVSKLRRALNDEAQEPRYIETIPRRGYRLLVTPQILQPSVNTVPLWRWKLTAVVLLVLLAAIALFVGLPLKKTSDPNEALIDQGLAYYDRYTREGNESAIELFERVLARDPDNARALAALSNAFSQRALRWPDETSQPPPQHSTLTLALQEGRLGMPNARLNLDAARAFAERSVEEAPESAAAWKALGLVLSAQGEVDAAIIAYEKALEFDPEWWGAMINLAELHAYRGDQDKALAMLEETYALRPDYADLGVLIGNEYEGRGKTAQARLRYRNVLSYAPFHRGATLALAKLLLANGEAAEAIRLCERLVERTGPFEDCDAIRTHAANE